MDHCALNDALEPGRGLGILAAIADEIVEFLIDIIAQVLAQNVEIDRTRPQHRRGIAVLGETQ